VNTVKYDPAGLKTLHRQIGELESMRAQVGLFRETAGRVSDPGRISDNPSLGAVHEFGDPKHNIPARSFLLMPMVTQLGKLLAAKSASVIYLLRTRGARRLLGWLGVLGEDVVQESFATRGWGQWPALKIATIKRKKSSAILIESAQMRRAVSSRVV
jgi:hypothetical protein